MGRLLVILLVLALLAAGLFAWESVNFNAPGPAAANGAAETDVLISPGIGLKGVAETLQEAGVVENPGLFMIGVRVRRTTEKLKAGEFAIPSRASMYDIMDILIFGKAIQHKITAAEGLTSEMVAKLVAADPVLAGKLDGTPPEGTLLPETYLFTRGTTRTQIVERMQKAQDDLVADLWAKRAPGLPLKSPREALILASIVEKETSLPEERRHIRSEEHT